MQELLLLLLQLQRALLGWALRHMHTQQRQLLRPKPAVPHLHRRLQRHRRPAHPAAPQSDEAVQLL